MGQILYVLCGKGIEAPFVACPACLLHLSHCRRPDEPLLRFSPRGVPLRFGDWEHPEHAAVHYGLGNLERVWEVSLRREL